MHETRGAVHLLHGVRGDVHVEFVVRGVVVRGGRARSRARALGAPTADGDASAGFSLESLLGSTAGADDQTDERVPGVFSRGDVHAQLARGRAVVSRGYVRGIERAEFVRDVAPLGVPSVPTSLFSRVDAAAGGAVVLGGRGGGSLVGWRKRNGDGGLHARGELLDARSHGERAAAASGGLVARKGAPPGADSRGARRGRWRARGMGSARAPGSIATSAPLTLDGGVAPEGPSVDVARVPASPAPGSGRTRRGGGGFAAGEARTAMPLASVTFCAARAPWRRSRRRCRSWSPPTAPRATDADAEPKLLRFSARPTKRALARDRPRTSCAFRGRWKRARVRTTRAPSDPLSRSGDAEATSESENVRALSVSVPRETRASASERLFLPRARWGKSSAAAAAGPGARCPSAPPAVRRARSPARWEARCAARTRRRPRRVLAAAR